MRRRHLDAAAAYAVIGLWGGLQQVQRRDGAGLARAALYPKHDSKRRGGGTADAGNSTGGVRCERCLISGRKTGSWECWECWEAIRIIPQALALCGEACSCNPSARTTFSTVANSGLPSGESALYKLSLPSPVSRAIFDMPRARAISPNAAAISWGLPSSKAASR